MLRGISGGQKKRVTAGEMLVSVGQCSARFAQHGGQEGAATAQLLCLVACRCPAAPIPPVFTGCTSLFWSPSTGRPHARAVC